MTFVAIGTLSYSEILTGNPINYIIQKRQVCHLLLTIANSLDPDQGQQNVGPDLDPNCLKL